MSDAASSDSYDVVIAGGGPAGLAAALMLGRVRRRVLVCDTRQGRNATVASSHGYFTRDGISPDELLRTGREQLLPYSNVEICDESVDDAGPDAGGFVARLGDGRRITARRLLLATGLVDDLPEVEGLADVWGRTAFHCPYCDGWETQGKAVAVLGDGEGAVRLALQLVRFTPAVTVYSNGASVEASVSALLVSHGIDLRTDAVVRVERSAEQTRGLVLASGETFPCDRIFVATLHRQHSNLPERLGCALLEDGSVQVNDFGQTSVPGIYAAGDMARRPAFPFALAQIMFAAASGQLAAGAIDQELLLTDMPEFPSPLRQAKPSAVTQSRHAEPFGSDLGD